MSRHLTRMEIEDAEHFSPEQRQAIIDSYPEHEREARTRGLPTLGSGRVFPIADSEIKCEPFDIPSHFAAINGIDFGWDHPTAAVSSAWDRDADIWYVTRSHRLSKATPPIHCSTLRHWGADVPWAWPHDGLQADKGSGEQLAAQHAAEGLAMLPERATFVDGSNGVEAGVSEMLVAMQTGRFKVFSHLTEWFEEFRLYHREDGKIVKLRDDLLSATRYARMMKRFAQTRAELDAVRYPSYGGGGSVRTTGFM
jgi:hypothetical protein